MDAEQKLHDTKQMVKKLYDELAERKRNYLENIEQAKINHDKNAESRYNALIREHNWFAGKLEVVLQWVQ